LLPTPDSAKAEEMEKPAAEAGFLLSGVQDRETGIVETQGQLWGQMVATQISGRRKEKRISLGVYPEVKLNVFYADNGPRKPVSILYIRLWNNQYGEFYRRFFNLPTGHSCPILDQ